MYDRELFHNLDTRREHDVEILYARQIYSVDPANISIYLMVFLRIDIIDNDITKLPQR